MPLSLEQYVLEYLPGRGLPWPVMPRVESPKAKPSLRTLPVRAVLWNVYGTLLAIPTGELRFQAQIEFATDAAFDKTVQEFKMWNSMSRKPGAPGAYMREMFNKALELVRVTCGEPKAELVWDDILKKLMGKEYTYDAGQFGPPAEYVKKIAYFYHASIQGTGCYPGAANALRLVIDTGVKQGLLADGQCFTPLQLLKGLREQDPLFDLDLHLPASLRVLSADHGAGKPNDELFRAGLAAAKAKGVSAGEVLHVGSSLTRDIAPAKKLGMMTALFAGDKGSLQATGEQLRDPQYRPDVLITELQQIVDVIS